MLLKTVTSKRLIFTELISESLLTDGPAIFNLEYTNVFFRIMQDNDVDAVSDDLFTMTSRKNDKNGAVITSNDDVVLGRDPRTKNLKARTSEYQESTG